MWQPGVVYQKLSVGFVKLRPPSGHLSDDRGPQRPTRVFLTDWLGPPTP